MRWLVALALAGAVWAETGSWACAPCHREIFEKQRRSGMARSSGRVGDGFEKFDAGVFRGPGARYRVTPTYEVDFGKGTFRMEYFVGSGAVGRSYAGFVDGFLFQSPASYYSARGAWGLSPGYATKPFVDVARPVERACLQCHATGARAAAGTQNAFGDPPFAEGGVGCERCHGAGESHVARTGPIINPAKLPAARRDSVCLQCHLTGAARVARAGKGPETFRVGELLSDHLMVFVGGRGGERAATDHAEQLARSRCAQASGEKLWCGTCHDAHAGSTRQAACLDCHKPHANGGADCAGCHMPKGRSREGEHVVYTDHTIARKPGSVAALKELRPFAWMAPTEREWALAEPAKNLGVLEKLAARADADAAVLVQLAQLYDGRGKGGVLYERALGLQPDHATAMANLGIYRMQEGRSREALALWTKAFAKNPGLLAVGLNLAMGQVQAGDKLGAAATLRRVLRFHPDSAQARDLLGKLL